MCRACGMDAEFVCFCEFPLATLCPGQCLQKHRSQAGFHFEMPVYITPFVQKENFAACQSWLFNLSRAQQALRKNIASIDAFEVDIGSAFEHVKQQIEAMKEEYLAAIRAIK